MGSWEPADGQRSTRGLAALGDVHRNLGDLESAAGVFRKEFQESGHPQFHFALALVLEKQGDQAGALRELEKAVALQPMDPKSEVEAVN